MNRTDIGPTETQTLTGVRRILAQHPDRDFFHFRTYGTEARGPKYQPRQQPRDHNHRHRGDFPGPPALSTEQIQRPDRPPQRGNAQQNPADHQDDKPIGTGQVRDEPPGV
ncbi:hypothetical protein ACIHDR_20130 [Nocardia sp. NPDC052278]|uniref:hypothetical protein n=1 Tax=unclassified Nocardia TaxID=2637762 RepID=UPI0036AC72DF